MRALLELAAPLDLKEVVRGAKLLPPSGQVVPQLQSLLAEFNSPSEDIALLLRIDASLAMRVLRVANSPAFFRGLACDSVDEAIQLLGFIQINQIVSAIAARDMLDEDLPYYGRKSSDLHRTSLATALGATAFNQKARFGQGGDLIFTAGLLHCVGMATLDRAVRASCPQIVEVVGGVAFSPEEEREHFGFDFAQVSAAMLERWNFSPGLVRIIRCLFDPVLPADEAAAIVALRLGRLAVPLIVAPDAAAPEVRQALYETAGKSLLALPGHKIDEALVYAHQMFELFGAAL